MEIKFEELLAPIEVLIMIVFAEYAEDKLKLQCQNYKDEIFTSKESISKLNELIKTTTIKTKMLLSNDYKENILKYYNEDGIELYIFSNFKKLLYNMISEHPACEPRRKF